MFFSSSFSLAFVLERSAEEVHFIMLKMIMNDTKQVTTT